MNLLLEKIIIYGIVGIFLLVVLLVYILKLKRESRIVEEKIKKAREEGVYEPVSLHPVVDANSCIQSGACIKACPEKDILGIRNGKATTINASHCVGHGACFNACPTQAITLCIGTEKRGVDLPHVNQYFESNVRGIYLAGEIGGMGLIKNAVEQGRQAVENIALSLNDHKNSEYDLIIVGAGPAGISATLAAKKYKLKALTLEQDSLGGTVFTFPRSKIVMTSPMDLPLFGKIKLSETRKEELLKTWKSALKKNDLEILEYQKVEAVTGGNGAFTVQVLGGEKFTAKKILLAIGRRGTPRKLNIPGENSKKVAYRLLEPEFITGKDIIVVGGGDSAIESALLLASENRVILSYRKDSFSRLKPKNKVKIEKAFENKQIDILYNSNVVSIQDDNITIQVENEKNQRIIKNDLVFIFAGGELPTQFLKNAGIEITRKYGEAILKHKKN